VVQERTYPGTLVLVVGGSGVGKDSLLAGARNQLTGHANFSFPKRLVTRKPVSDLEDHDTVTFDEYLGLASSGKAALNWQAHGLGYIIPKTIENDLEVGKVVACNVSRTIIADAAYKYPVHVVNIVAELELRAKRLANRGRENEDSIRRRLAREPIALPTDIPTTKISNNGEMKAGIKAMVDLLISLQTQNQE